MNEGDVASAPHGKLVFLLIWKPLLQPIFFLFLHLSAQLHYNLENSFAYKEISEDANHIFELFFEADLNSVFRNTVDVEFFNQISYHLLFHFQRAMVPNSWFEQASSIVLAKRVGGFIAFNLGIAKHI